MNCTELCCLTVSCNVSLIVSYCLLLMYSTALARPNAANAILSSIESLHVLSNPFPSKPSVVFRLINYSTVSLTIPLKVIWHFLVPLSSNLVLSSPDVNKNKRVAEIDPLKGPP